MKYTFFCCVFGVSNFVESEIEMLCENNSRNHTLRACCWSLVHYGVREDIMTTFIVDNNKFKAINLANWATTRQTFAVNMLVYICECMNYVRIILCWHDEGEGGNNKNTAYT